MTNQTAIIIKAFINEDRIMRSRERSPRRTINMLARGPPKIPIRKEGEGALPIFRRSILNTLIAKKMGINWKDDPIRESRRKAAVPRRPEQR